MTLVEKSIIFVKKLHIIKFFKDMLKEKGLKRIEKQVIKKN